MKSKSIYNIALAVTILLLLLLGGKVNNNTATAIASEGEENEALQAEEVGRPVGLGNHTLKKDKVTLAEGSKPATTQEDYEKYRKHFTDACDVELGEDAKNGYIIVSYSKNSKAAQKGCTLDLYTTLDKRIEFRTFLKNDNSGGPEVCVKEEEKNYNDNVLPFAYSHPADLAELQEGPILQNSNKGETSTEIDEAKSSEGCKSEICLKETCIKRTALELRWIKDEVRRDGKDKLRIELRINPIGSPAYRKDNRLLDKFNEEPPVYPIVEIERTDYNVRFQEPIPGNYHDEDRCILNRRGPVISPVAWKINGANPNQKMKHLLVFHLLPQKASRNIEWRVFPGAEPKVLSDPPTGPECEELQILFSTANYTLLTVDNSTTTTTSTISSTSTTTSTKATTTKVTTTTEEPASFPWIIIVIVVVLLISSVSGAIVFVFLKKKGGGSDGGDKTKMDNDKGTKSKKDDKGDDKSKTDKDSKSANSEASTNSKVKDAEEGKKEGTSSTA